MFIGAGLISRSAKYSCFLPKTRIAAMLRSYQMQCLFTTTKKSFKEKLIAQQQIRKAKVVEHSNPGELFPRKFEEKEERDDEDQIENNEESELDELLDQPGRIKTYSGSHDTVEDLIDFGVDAEVSRKKAQKILFDRILQSESAQKNSEIKQKYVTLDDIFKKREQKLTFQLLNLENPIEIMNLYESEVARIDAREGDEDYLSVDEVSLFFYFATMKKQFLSDNNTFQKILTKIISDAASLSSISLQQFIWSFGAYSFQFGLFELSEAMKKNLSEAILNKCAHFDYSTNVQFAFALTQIFQGELDYPLTEPIIQVLATNCSKHIETLTSEEVITMLLVFMKVQLEDKNQISNFVERLISIKEELSEEQITKAINALGELNYSNSKQFFILSKEILERDKGKPQPDMSVDTACSLIFTLSGAKEKKEVILKSFLRIVHSKYKEMNITNYVHLWLGLARFQIDPKQYEQTFSILLKVFSSGHIFTLLDLSTEELTKIIVSASSLKLDNRVLVGEIFKVCEKKLKRFTPEQLVFLTKSSIIYVKQFESFFIAIHAQCLAQLDKFSYEQKLQLRAVFNRTRILFPDSPLIELSL